MTKKTVEVSKMRIANAAIRVTAVVLIGFGVGHAVNPLLGWGVALYLTQIAL
jgi:hypothetical protein